MGEKRASVPGAADRSFAAHPETGSAGRPAEQLLDTSALALGRTARATVAGSHRDSLLAGRKGRAVVDIAPGGNGCADTLGDDPLDDHPAWYTLVRPVLGRPGCAFRCWSRASLCPLRAA
jgi:hypothetical protein